MAKIWLTKILNGCLQGTAEIDRVRLSKVPVGIDILVDWQKPRNPLFHKKYFALLNIAFENQDIYDVFEEFRTEIKLKAGAYKTHVTTKGKLIYIPKSIAFDKMDEIEFGELYQKSLDVILRHFMQGTSEDELQERVDEIIGFA